MRCWSFTKPLHDFKRCKNHTKWYYPFCHRHRFIPIYYLISIGAALIYFTDFIGVFGIESPFNRNSTEAVAQFKPIFDSDDSLNFNILILRFEDFYSSDDNECVGKTIQDILTSYSNSETYDLPVNINAVYVGDTIRLPQSPQKGSEIKSKHNADLLLFGIANMKASNCSEADVCFRYSLSDKTLTTVPAFINVETEKYDRSFNHTTVSELEVGSFQINSNDFLTWINALVFAKARDNTKSFTELDKLVSSKAVNISEKSDRILEIANTYFSLDYYVKALDALDENRYIFEKADEDARLTFYSMRAGINLSLGRVEEALLDYNMCLGINEHNPAALSSVGSLLSVNQPVQAIHYMTKAISNNSTISTFYVVRAGAYAKLNDFDSAVSDLLLAIDLNKNNSFLYARLGEYLLKNNKPDFAIKALNMSLSIDSISGDVFTNLGLCYMVKKETDQSLESFRKAIEKNPENITALGGRAVQYRFNNNYDLALKDYQSIIKVKPNNGIALTGELEMLIEMQEYKKSLGKCASLLKNESLKIDRMKIENLCYEVRKDYNSYLKDRRSKYFYLGVIVIVLLGFVIWMIRKYNLL